MPYIECHIATGLTKARKTQLIRDIVGASFRAGLWHVVRSLPGRRSS